jgi:hypothetical protein
MSAPQMICHLCDAYVGAMGEKHASVASGLLQRTVVKFGALWIPMQWPKGVPTRPEMDQRIGGTPPMEFEQDRRKLADVIQRFCASNRDFRWTPHPLFGVMSDLEWLRWGYLHADHHFRQFDC